MLEAHIYFHSQTSGLRWTRMSILSLWNQRHRASCCRSFQRTPRKSQTCGTQEKAMFSSHVWGWHRRWCEFFLHCLILLQQVPVLCSIVFLHWIFRQKKLLILNFCLEFNKLFIFSFWLLKDFHLLNSEIVVQKIMQYQTGLKSVSLIF